MIWPYEVHDDDDYDVDDDGGGDAWDAGNSVSLTTEIASFYRLMHHYNLT